MKNTEYTLSISIINSGCLAIVQFVADAVEVFEYYDSISKHLTEGQVARLLSWRVE